MHAHATRREVAVLALIRLVVVGTAVGARPLPRGVDLVLPLHTLLEDLELHVREGLHEEPPLVEIGGDTSGRLLRTGGAERRLGARFVVGHAPAEELAHLRVGVLLVERYLVAATHQLLVARLHSDVGARDEDGGLRQYRLEAVHALEVRRGRRRIEDAAQADAPIICTLEVHVDRSAGGDDSVAGERELCRLEVAQVAL
mmetsp:Transcript_9245/g.23001  ORF Transcript_9245/g.23001 Transcript_9245/m.23001 type:complete len:200 (-) Transcript_9245:534-1133(-)